MGDKDMVQMSHLKSHKKRYELEVCIGSFLYPLLISRRLGELYWNAYCTEKRYK